jgi:hypothetical protein
MTVKKTKKTADVAPAAPKKTRKKVVAAPAEVPVAAPAPVAAEPTPAVITDPEAAPQLLKLTDAERLKLRLFESESARWAGEAHIRQGRRAAHLQKIDPEGQLTKMDQELRAVAERSSAAKRQYLEVVRSIESRLDIKLSNYSFDDESGALIPH